MMKSFYLYIGLFFYASSSFAQLEDSLFELNSTLQWEKLAKIDSIGYKVSLPGSHTSFKNSYMNTLGPEYLKIGKSAFIVFGKTGRVYQLSDTLNGKLRFRRLDNTININYNIGANVFIFENQLFNFGGYGFWKSNGILRRFNESSSEWFEEPVSREIVPQFSPIPNSWYSYKENKLYVAFQRIINTGVKGDENVKGVLVPRSYRLDMKTKDWEELGDCAPEIIKIFNEFHSQFNYSSLGLFIDYAEEIYWLDFEQNKVRKCQDKSYSLQVHRKIFPNWHFLKKDTVFYYDTTQQKMKAFPIQLELFKEESYPIWETTPYNSWWWIVLLFIFGYLGWEFFKRNKKSTQKNQTPAVPEDGARQEAPIFTDLEKKLLSHLCKNSRNQVRTTIDEINYLLGLKDKNTGLQKKIRSDFFQSVNLKYKLWSGIDHPLVISLRSESDKRFFEYLIAEEKLNTLETLLDANGN